MAYGDRLHVRVRSTGDFRFEKRSEVEVDEVGIIVNNSVELDLDELHEKLELDTRGIPVRQFDGHLTYIDAGADSAMLDFIVNVASDVTALGLTGTIAYVSGKVRGQRQQRGEREHAASITEPGLVQLAIETAQLKFGVAADTVEVESVEMGIDGRGVVELTISQDRRKFRIDLECYEDGIRVYRVKRMNLGSPE